MQDQQEFSRLINILNSLKGKANQLGVKYKLIIDPDLSLKNPGQYENGEIRIWDGLSAYQKIEAEIHELYHAILQSIGFASVSINNDYFGTNNLFSANMQPIDLKAINITNINNILDDAANSMQLKEIADVVSNIIHHAAIISALLNEYNLTSNLQSLALSHNFFDIKNDIMDRSKDFDAHDYHAHGIFLADMVMTIPDYRSEIESILLNDSLKNGYQLALEHLIPIKPELDCDTQKKHLEIFFHQLGYCVDKFKIYLPDKTQSEFSANQRWLHV